MTRFYSTGRKGLYECGAWCVLFVFGIGGERERDVMRGREAGSGHLESSGNNPGGRERERERQSRLLSFSALTDGIVYRRPS